MRKKILILGAGKGQVPFVELCKRKGYESIVVSIKGDYPCFSLADRFYYVDICDKEGVLKIAKEEKVDAILNQLDVGCSTVAYVSAQLGLPSIGMDVVNKFTNKCVMIQEAQKCGVFVPKYFSAKTLDEAIQYAPQLGYPFVIKPTDSTASKGVKKIENLEMLIESFNSTMAYSKEKQVLLEEYIEGQEYVIDSFVQDYLCTPLIIGKSKYFNLENMFIPQSRFFVRAEEVEDEIQKEIIDTNEKLISSLKLKFGITHGEYVYRPKDGKVYLIEIAARGGGVNIASDLIPLLCGLDANEMLLNYLLGEQNKITSLLPTVKVAGYLCFLLPNGTIKVITGKENIHNIEYVYKVFLDNIYLNKQITASTDKGARFGPILIAAESKEQCYQAINRIQNRLHVEVQTQEGLKDIIWD